MYELLKTIDSPADLRKLARKDLGPWPKSCAAMCWKRGANRWPSVVEPRHGRVDDCIALLFNTPEDRLVWDVGHQTYPHKILTGGASAWIRCASWAVISGFPRRVESEYDTLRHRAFLDLDFRGLRDGPGRAPEGRGPFRGGIIGDGAMTAGMAFEAMNNAGVHEDAR